MKPIQSPADQITVSNLIIPPLGLVAYTGLTPVTVSSSPEDCLSYRRLFVVFGAYVGASSDTTVQLLLQERAGTSGAYSTFHTGVAIADGTENLQLIEVDLTKRRRYLRAGVVISGTTAAGEIVRLTALLTGRVMGRQRDLQPVTPITV